MSTSISIFDIDRVKQHAKLLKSKHPTAKHQTRLDIAAKELFLARNFHELNQWRENTIARFIINEGQSSSRCSFCGLGFVSDSGEDKKEHRRQHDQFEHATSILNYVPEHDSARGARIQNGYALLRDTDVNQNIKGAIDVLRCWFDRSLKEAIRANYWKIHPKFETYISYLTGYLPPIPPQVTQILIERYGRLDGVIEPGKHNWYPPK